MDRVPVPDRAELLERLGLGELPAPDPRCDLLRRPDLVVLDHHPGEMSKGVLVSQIEFATSLEPEGRQEV